MNRNEKNGKQNRTITPSDRVNEGRQDHPSVGKLIRKTETTLLTVQLGGTNFGFRKETTTETQIIDLELKNNQRPNRYNFDIKVHALPKRNLREINQHSSSEKILDTYIPPKYPEKSVALLA